MYHTGLLIKNRLKSVERSKTMYGSLVPSLRESLINLLKFIQVSPFDFDQARDARPETPTPFHETARKVREFQFAIDEAARALIDGHRLKP